MKRLLLISILLTVFGAAVARNVTVNAVDRPAAEVFRDIAGQTGMNFVYSSDILADMLVTVNVTNKSVRQALSAMFKDSGIEYKIKGKNIILKKKPEAKKAQKITAIPQLPQTKQPEMLNEIIVVSRLEAPTVETSEIGARKLTAREIASAPTLFGESDVLKALQMQPGITSAAEGMAAMNVHGGNADENLFMLDNVPLYQVNHYMGLFSAFNVDAIRYIDFFKSSIPAKYDGRLSSYLDVRTKNGPTEGHSGSFKLGLTSGSFYLEGAIGHKTSYSVGLRRSWSDVFSAPVLSIVNSSSDEEKVTLNYAFMDLNGKITHRFNNRATGFVSVYFGNDLLKNGSKYKNSESTVWHEDYMYNMHWGNLVAQAGFNYKLQPDLSAEFTAAYTRFFSNMKHEYTVFDNYDNIDESKGTTKTDNNINDWIFRGDFDWRPNEVHRVRFGAGYTLHSFLPQRTSRRYTNGDATLVSRDSTWSYLASEANIYIEDDMRLGDKFRINAGFHGSLFNISDKTHLGAGPRLSASYRPHDNWAFKAVYSRTTQYVHQLCQTYLSLPTDQWVPITGKFKPQTADKISAAAYWQSDNGNYTVSAEAYYKWMRNLVDYRDEYYLQPPTEMWNSRLCSGRGTAKGIDLKVEKLSGKVTGHIAYSLGWADRTFAEKNGGHTFPARFDHRHTINILLNWNISAKVQLNAAWTGHSGNRFTLLTQTWELRNYDNSWFSYQAPLKARINNYQLPFYHRLDLSCTVRNRRGYWNFGLYNAYCNMNTVAISRSSNSHGPVFKKFKMIPLIPSISYTWKF